MYVEKISGETRKYKQSRAKQSSVEISRTKEQWSSEQSSAKKMGFLKHLNILKLSVVGWSREHERTHVASLDRRHTYTYRSNLEKRNVGC